MANDFDTTSYLSVKPRSINVDHLDRNNLPLGVHSKVLTTLYPRHVEIEATASPLTLRLTEYQHDLLRFEFELMKPEVDRKGRVLTHGLYGIALWMRIAKELKDVYKSLNFAQVQDELTSAYLNVIRPLWQEQYMQRQARGRGQKRKSG